MNKLSKKHFVRIIKRSTPVIFYILLVIFLVFYLKSIDLDKIKSVNFAWKYVLVASILGLVTRYWAVFIWFVLLKGLGAKHLGEQKSELTYVYSKSWLGRYIPGTAPWILGKIYFASKHGVSKNKLAVSSLLEGGLQVTVVMVVAFLMLIFDHRLDVIDVSLKFMMVAVIAICIVVVLPPVFNRIISLVYRLIRRKVFSREHYASGATIAKGASLFAISAIFSGLSLFFIAKSVYPQLGYHDIWFVMGAGNLAAAASMLAIFAPSGLGVREGIQLVLLSVIMPKEIALVVVVVTRLWSVAIDFIFFGLSALIQKLTPSKT